MMTIWGYFTHYYCTPSWLPLLSKFFQSFKILITINHKQIIKSVSHMTSAKSYIFRGEEVRNPPSYVSATSYVKKIQLWQSREAISRKLQIFFAFSSDLNSVCCLYALYGTYSEDTNTIKDKIGQLVDWYWVTILDEICHVNQIWPLGQIFSLKIMSNCQKCSNFNFTLGIIFCRSKGTKTVYRYHLKCLLSIGFW